MGRKHRQRAFPSLVHAQPHTLVHVRGGCVSVGEQRPHPTLSSAGTLDRPSGQLGGSGRRPGEAQGGVPEPAREGVGGPGSLTTAQAIFHRQCFLGATPWPGPCNALSPLNDVWLTQVGGWVQVSGTAPRLFAGCSEG